MITDLDRKRKLHFKMSSADRCFGVSKIPFESKFKEKKKTCVK